MSKELFRQQIQPSADIATEVNKEKIEAVPTAEIIGSMLESRDKRVSYENRRYARM